MNDSTVSQVSIKTVLSQQAYIVFYSKSNEPTAADATLDPSIKTAPAASNPAQSPGLPLKSDVGNSLKVEDVGEVQKVNILQAKAKKPIVASNKSTTPEAPPAAVVAAVLTSVSAPLVGVDSFPGDLHQNEKAQESLVMLKANTRLKPKKSYTIQVFR